MAPDMKPDMTDTLVYTDLDGTLLDHDTYGFEDAESTLNRLKRVGVPVIICSSKTRAEIEVLRGAMGLEDPFISENGGAVFIPHAMADLHHPGMRRKAGYAVLELGRSYEVLVGLFGKIKQKGAFQMSGFYEWTPDEIARQTGLSIEAARLAACREYSEPFVFYEDAQRLQQLEALIHDQGLHVTKGGRFYHLIGDNDKGRAVESLTRLYRQRCPEADITTIGLGDSANDLSMLRRVDKPVVIRKKTGHWEAFNGRQDTYFSKASGPKGWAEAIDGLCFHG